MVEILIAGDKTCNLRTNMPRDSQGMEVVKMRFHARPADTDAADQTDENPAGRVPGNIIGERHSLRLGQEKDFEERLQLILLKRGHIDLSNSCRLIRRATPPQSVDLTESCSC
jgi:hypothetical protein